jgi:hypothetical protein
VASDTITLEMRAVFPLKNPIFPLAIGDGGYTLPRETRTGVGVKPAARSNHRRSDGS